ncbi:hypothetical protein, partial [Mesorhizobium sp.]|uniref:hypothetical protein n=1 Tax=Mesorhizobium sp. TaxID=1871066 RepID=UPI0025E122B8
LAKQQNRRTHAVELRHLNGFSLSLTLERSVGRKTKRPAGCGPFLYLVAGTCNHRYRHSLVVEI